MDDTFEKLYKRITAYINNSSEEILSGNVIDFTFYDGNYLSSPSGIEYTLIDLHNEPDIVKIVDYDNEYSEDNLDDILMHSIAGNQTIKLYGKVGYIALYLIYINEDKLLIDAENLKNICLQNLADKFNKLYNPTYNFFDNKNIDELLNIESLIKEIDLKQRLKAWIDLFEDMMKIPNDYIIDCMKYMALPIQKVLFKQTFDTIILSYNIYNNNYDDEIDLLDDNKIVKYLKEMYKISTINEWIIFLKKLIENSPLDIMKIFMYCDVEFICVFLNVKYPLSSGKIFTNIFRISESKYFKYINDKYYELSIAVYDQDNKKKYICKSYVYDKYLNIIGYKIYKNIGPDRKILEYDLTGNLISS